MLGTAIIKKISRKFEPESSVYLQYRKLDLIIITDKEGNAIQLFIGKMNDKGLILGDRYRRNIIKDHEGKVIKDYWDRKGKAN